MTVNIPGWSPALERPFKELIYRFLEEIHSTKAALYLLGSDGSYALVTQYGFGRRDLLAAEFRPDEAMILKVRELRHDARSYNRPEAVPELAAYLEGAGTARMLLVPLFAGSRILGFVDARDKGRKEHFTREDEAKAGEIAGAFVELLRRSSLYLGLEDAGAPPPVSVRPRTPEAAAEGEVAGESAALLDEEGLRQVDEALVAVASGSEVTAALLTIVDGGSAVSRLLCGESPAGREREALVRHQAAVLHDAGVPTPEAEGWELQVVTELERVDVGARVIASGVLLERDGWALAASLVAAMGSSAAVDALARVRAAAERARAGAVVRFARRRLARALLQPGERRYPELEGHSLAVSRLAWQMAHVHGLAAQEVEDAALLGLLHDVGMREIDYGRLYRHPSPGQDERRLYQRHVVVGESILREAGLDTLAAAVRHHHERWDGTGYPDRLKREAIPLLSRLVHVAESFDTLTSDGSYRRPVAQERAVDILRAGAGHQFDPEMVAVLERAVE